MGSHVITESAPGMRSSQQARTRALVIPREHGAWGLLLVPLFTGLAVGLASVPKGWPVFLFTVAALSLFWLRTPVESLLGTTALSAQTSAERRIALLASLGLAALSGICLAGLLWGGRNFELWLIGAAGAGAFIAQTLLKQIGRNFRMPAQIVGSIGLTCTAPAAYYLATGQLDRTAWLLWAANWIFAGDQIHFVQLRIHAARAATLREKFTRGRSFFLAQALLVTVLVIAGFERWIPALVTLAFLPALARGFGWFFRPSQPLQVRSLGWSEMRQGIAFGIVLAATLIISRCLSR